MALRVADPLPGALGGLRLLEGGPVCLELLPGGDGGIQHVLGDIAAIADKAQVDPFVVGDVRGHCSYAEFPLILPGVTYFGRAGENSGGTSAASGAWIAQWGSQWDAPFFSPHAIQA
jgi:hypothetical protein